MTSSPSLLEAYRKQCEHTGEPWAVLLLWWASGEVQRGEIERDDMVDISTEVARGQ